MAEAVDGELVWELVRTRRKQGHEAWLARVRELRCRPTVAAGGEHSLGLREDGSVQCWGDNLEGEAPPELEAAQGDESGREF